MRSCVVAGQGICFFLRFSYALEEVPQHLFTQKVKSVGIDMDHVCWAGACPESTNRQDSVLGVLLFFSFSCHDFAVCPVSTTQKLHGLAQPPDLLMVTDLL